MSYNLPVQQYSTETIYNVKDKVVVVTGGGTGLGRGIATSFASNGAKVFITSRRLEKLEQTAKEINEEIKTAQKTGEIIPIQGDCSTKAGVEAIYDQVAKLTDRVDVLVNNAGISGGWRVHAKWDDPEGVEKMLWSVEDGDFAKTTSIHVSGVYFMCVKFIGLMKKSDCASIINISSIASQFLNRRVCEFAYATSKAAENQLTRLLAASLSLYKIRVNAIEPGLFESDITVDPSTGKLWDLMAREAREVIPEGRCGIHTEIAGPVMMLSTPAGGYMNGQIITVDGAWTLFASASDM